MTLHCKPYVIAHANVQFTCPGSQLPATRKGLDIKDQSCWLLWCVCALYAQHVRHPHVEQAFAFHRMRPGAHEPPSRTCTVSSFNLQRRLQLA